VTKPAHRHWADAAALTAALLGDAVAAHFFVVGMAVQAGLLPIGAAAIERAIDLNGVGAEANRAAFRWGRAWIADPEAVSAAARVREPAAQAPPPVEALPPSLHAPLRAAAAGDAELAASLRRLAADLVAWQDARTAAGFLATVRRVAEREAEVVPGSTRLASAAAAGLHKLLAYKDEYEIARLLLAKDGLAPARALAGGAGGLTFHLHPPLLRALGLRRKLAIPAWAAPAFRLLAAAKVVRGTLLDPFGRTRLRRVERALPGEYRAALDAVLADLKPERLDDAVAIARLPDGVRGFEGLKLARAAEFRQRLAEELASFRDSAGPATGR
jgi:indolepyruvate ferredoxin oxidoreductase